MSRSSRKKARTPPPEVPIFSDRLTQVLETVIKGEAPNVGHFCGYCYTPIDRQRMHCPHCRKAVADYPAVVKVPSDVGEMFRKMRRRESLVVNSLAQFGIMLGVTAFIVVFYFLFLNDVAIWWYALDVLLLFVLSPVLAGLIGGYLGDEYGYRFAQRKLADEWAAFDSAREEQRSASPSPPAPLPRCVQTGDMGNRCTGT
jgi:hypothetical protein